MPDFQITHHILLSGVTATTGQLSWTGQSNSVRSATIADVAQDGILTQGVEAYTAGPLTFTYSGWYVSVGGRHFGVFSNGTHWFIPYNITQFNLGQGIPIVPEITAGSTSLRNAALNTAANCFLTGTRIATPTGPRAIETLRPGELVTTAEGGHGPVIWVWRQDLVNIPGVTDARAPIRIRAGALGPGLPARDLIVTADHALALDGLLIDAGALVNGGTIARLPLDALPGDLSYWHIEMPGHCLLLAEGCPAESFLPLTDRRAFADHAAYIATHGGERFFGEMALPRVSAARLLPGAIRQRLGIGLAA